MRFTKEQCIEKKKLFKLGLKQCPRCLKPKELSEFNIDNRASDFLQTYCKKHLKEYREKTENKARQKKYDKIYYIKYKEEKSQYNKEWRDKNKEKCVNKSKLRYLKDKKGIIKKNTEYAKNRLKIDINFKILCNLRSRINNSLKGFNKSLNTMFLIGCEIDYLMYHIQEQFTKGMSWDNYGKGKGKWNIDHIKPCSKFDLSKESEQRKCFHYSNLQPLWAEDNLKKGKKYEG
jgi:hypothetical protein